MSFLIQKFKNKAHFHYDDKVLGRFSVQTLNPELHAGLLYQWVVQDYARYWNMRDFSKPELEAFYTQLLAQPDKAAFIGQYAGEPAFLFELYAPENTPLSDHYQGEQGDCGMHLLVAPARLPRSGFTLAVMRTVMQFIFSEPDIKRVVVEPDIENHKIHRLNCSVGFMHIKPVQLPDKCAYLGLCSRAAFFNSAETVSSPNNDQMAFAHTAHLSPYYWERANRFLLAKIISEFSHEQILYPLKLRSDQGAAGYYELLLTDGLKYKFSARRMRVDHWLLNAASLTRFTKAENGDWDQNGAPDVLEFLVASRPNLDIGAQDFPLYLEEISSTLFSSCYKLSTAGRSADELCHADYQAVEKGMREGHPVFIANNGRIGFNISDYNFYAPESGNNLQIAWVAAKRTKAVFTYIDGLDYLKLIEQELDAVTLQKWCNRLIMLGLNPIDYYFMPVHPWQWQHKIAITFAGEVAKRDLVYLGSSPDYYQPQRSIRTFYNVTSPHKHYVKTALSVLNMGFMRGLSAEYMLTTPMINQWLSSLLETDAFLQRNGFRILRESAAVGYWNPIYNKQITQGSGYGKMLSALWRESPKQYLRPYERLMTMAALLHLDGAGRALLGSLMREANITAKAWIKGYLQAYLLPLLHCFYAYDLAFMPHGENVIMILKDYRIERILMKDIGEEIAVMNSGISIPEEISRIHLQIDEELKANYIFTDVFDGFFRHLAAILVDHDLMKEHDFWALVADTIREYQNSHPEYAAKYQQYDLFQPTMLRNCFNRLQMRNSRQMLDLLNPQSSFQFGDPMENPIANM